MKMKINKLINIIIAMLVLSELCFAENINIKSTEIYSDKNILYLNVNSEIFFTKEARKALLQGISFEMHADFELRTKLKWLFKKNVLKKKISYKLEHKPLTDIYLVTNLVTGTISYYKNLESTLNFISKINKMKLLNKNKLNENIDYMARIRFYIDIDSLPSPMRPRAYFSSDWNISSNWYEWEI